MADKNSRFQQFRERKRSRNEIREAFLKLSNLFIENMEQYFTEDRLDQSQMLALLVMYFWFDAAVVSKIRNKQNPCVTYRDSQ